MDNASERREPLGATAEIIAAYVGRNAVRPDDLPALISAVLEALRAAGAEQAAAEQAAAAPVPAVPVRRSVQRDFLVCLEDGQKQKLLKRHLATSHGLTPAQYRRRWGLADDYPMTAPAYAARRSALAKSFGLGRKPAVAPEPVAAAAEPVQQRAAGRKRAAA